MKNFKRIIRQKFCKHEHIEYRRPKTLFHNLQRETVYTFCADCGKLLNTEVISKEEFYKKFDVDSF